MLRGGDGQRAAQLVPELDEGSAVCPRGARGDGDLAGEDLDERIRHGLVGAGVADVDLQRHLCKRKKQHRTMAVSRAAPTATLLITVMGGGGHRTVRKSGSTSQTGIV